MESTNIVIGKRIRNLRKRKGLSQAVLSELIDTTPTYISYVENGQKGLSLETFIRLANALNVTADEILLDCLENTVKVSNHEFASVIFDCSDYEKHVLIDVITATKQALRDNAQRIAFYRR